MKIPEVTIVRKGGECNRLTINSNRVTLKLKDDVDEARELHFRLFATMIAQRTLSIYRRTMRGRFSADGKSIEVQNSNRSLYNLYCFDELAPEGLVASQIGATGNCTRPKKARSFVGIAPTGFSQPHKPKQTHWGESRSSEFSFLSDDDDVDTFVLDDDGEIKWEDENLFEKDKNSIDAETEAWWDNWNEYTGEETHNTD